LEGAVAFPEIRFICSKLQGKYKLEVEKNFLSRFYDKKSYFCQLAFLKTLMEEKKFFFSLSRMELGPIAKMKYPVCKIPWENP
jgi:hypothetical protein